MKTLPHGISSDIVVQALDDELLVYFLKTNRAICLNKTAAIVFNACNGIKTLDDLRREHKFTDDLIYLTLDELQKNNLLENYQSTYFANLSRREAVKRVGLATMIALPVVAQLVAPRASEAASGARLANGAICSTNTRCLSNRCGEDGFGPYCCSANDFGACQTSADCCSGIACSNNVCCQNNGRVCDTRSNNQCCAGLTCVAPQGQTNGTCQ